MILPILFEDDDLIIINKPSGLNSQPSHDRRLPDAFTGLQKQLNTKNIFLHHRIDKDTSGILLLGKSKQANKPLSEMFQNHQFERIYLALTKPGNKPLPANAWTVENYLRPYKEGKIMKQQVRNSGGDYAKTDFQTLDANQKACLILAKPHTGRMHQIRVHLAVDRRPIWGDRIYGGRPTAELQNLIPRLMLHAWKMNFIHPITNSAIEVTAPLPSDFQQALDKLGLSLHAPDKG